MGLAPRIGLPFANGFTVKELLYPANRERGTNMTVATIRTKLTFLLLATVLTVLSASRSNAGEIVSIRLTGGKKMTAELHPRTSGEHLWLRFGEGTTVILRSVAWERVESATIEDEPVSVATLQQLAARESEEDRSTSAPAPRPSTEPTYAEQARDMLGFSRRVTSVDFDAQAANWDRDVEFDGIVLRLFPLDANGQLTTARGTLYVELIAGRRVDFDQAPTSRGLVPSRIADWSVAVNAQDVSENGVVVKLPFQTNQPEFDTKWLTHGLVHVRFVVPGHGVFEHSFDGVRVRPYAPLRDTMERNGGQRFLPTEQTGVGKRFQSGFGPQ
ncbi:MAG: hypothetical protein H6821_10530 [Planctomycetaceae bacterium]|nr:hypothetical protein [Planctomycetales bacterium]MCB9874602.1 hypothetical protein [Planctomycetaceae bacterium]MCB9938632.1 hypothetical protein [Planctomycetaceae bacterium]